MQNMETIMKAHDRILLVVKFFEKRISIPPNPMCNRYL